jgi:glycosyltransferase involved in cell wall biosynthesis
MRILVSALLVNTTPGKAFAGVGRHMYQVLNQLATTPSNNHYEVYIRDDQEIPEKWRLATWITWRPVTIRNSRDRIRWEHFRIGKEAKRLSCQAIICLFIHLPLFTTLPIISFAHDAFPRTHGNWFPPRKRFLLDRLTQHACRKSSVLITASEFSKSELIRVYGIRAERVVVGLPGIGNELRILGPEGAREICGPNLPSGRFVFSIGTLEPRKNLEGLVKGFAKLKTDPSFSDVSLLIAGARGWMDSGLSEVVEQSGVKDSIRFLGYVSDAELNAMMQCANLFALVSHVEGFGIPVLEAMSVGTPVVTSNTSALPEVIGESAFFCDPSSTDSIAAAIAAGLTETDRAERYRQAGLERSRMFTWDRFVIKIEESLIIIFGSHTQ